MSTRTAPDHYLPCAGASLRWRQGGAGPAIMLLHGWALDLDYWDPAKALLTQDFSVLRFDRRGFGLSSGQPDIHRNVPDLLAVLDAAALRSAVLVGMSQGARLALHFAARHPQRTRALVLDGAPAFEAEAELPMTQYRRQLEEHGSAALHAAILRHPLMQLRSPDESRQQLLAGIVARYRGLDLLNSAPHARAPDLHALTVPTLIINGSLDSPARLAAGLELQASIAGAQRVQIEGAGHLAELDDPAAYAAHIAAFCRSLQP